jgi:D-alanyl-D-alanine carboxypeptidase
MLITVIGYQYYQINNLREEVVYEQKKREETSIEMQSAISTLQNHIASTTNENRDLSDLLTILKARNQDYQNEIIDKEQKVEVLKKLSETDQELLQKYSKTYFLNENYIPSSLSLIDEAFLFNKNSVVEIHTDVKPFLENLIRKARDDGMDLSVLSGYRSFEVQKNVKTRHTVIYGSSANRFSADQGYSEHQLGTTVDFTTSKTGSTLTGFEKTNSYKWFLDYAHEYGFTISYPEGNQYYIFEPWHWRFVGVSLATFLHAQNKHFYDLSQRDIDSYLIKIFN